ncbi:serine hydrolase domain-containing protein [Clostridium sp. AWRP]|uniref:serine hydrolase domain-containing protein n=1 Tax=Clostridium sp. AWRP TaxID=2212991 RepID=UPI001585FEFF|nr:serine hydrolase domain-containing protein [Clostridium sp. AWRP]
MCYERFKKNTNFLKNKLIKRMFAIISMFIICFGSNVTVFAESNSSDNLFGSKDDMKVFMDNTFQKKMKEQHVPGAVITVVKDGKVIFSKGYGYADLENKVPVTPDKTLVRIASVSKLFTYTAMMQLSEQGKVDLKADVNKYLKGYTLKNKYSNPVTVEELLTHTSGIDDNRIADLSKDKRDLLPMNDFLKKHLPKVIREPGTVINYSSYDAALAGGIVEQVSGKPLNNFIKDNIFKPLKMSNSTLNRDMNPKGLECGYNYENDKIVKAELLKGYFNNYAVGGIISTSEDMAKFMIAQLNNGAYRDKRILQESTAIDMHSQHATFDKRLPGMAYGFNEKYIKGYRAIEHPGYSPDNIYSDMTLFPDENLGVFISINQGMNNLPDEIVSEMVAKYFPKKEEAKNKKPYYTSKSNLKDFIGTYRFSENPVSTFHKGDAFPEGEDVTVSLKDGKALTLTGKDVFVGNKYSTTLKEIEPLVFKRDDTGEYVVFKKDKNGQIYYLAQQQDSWHGTYEKLKWYELSIVQIGVTLFSLIIFLIVIIFSIGRIIYNTIKKKNGETNPLKKTNFYMTFVISLLNITFFIAALFVLGEPTRYGISVGAKLLLCVPILSLILNLLFLVFIVMDWMKKNSKLHTRLYYLIVALTGILYMWFLNYWNLFGFKY